MNTVKFCQDQFGFELPSVLIVKRIDRFLARYKQFELDHNCFNLLFIVVINVYTLIMSQLSFVSHLSLYLFCLSYSIYHSW